MSEAQCFRTYHKIFFETAANYFQKEKKQAEIKTHKVSLTRVIYTASQQTTLQAKNHRLTCKMKFLFTLQWYNLSRVHSLCLL